ncbi:hypothetical protein J3E69DRAFT_328974 [Trichoderma sp. SZMC 28015]
MRVTLDTCFGKLGIKEIMDFYSCFFVFALCREGKSEGGIKGGDHEEGFSFMVGCCTFVSKGTCCYAYDTLFTKHI